MKHLFWLFFSAALLSSGCSVFKKKPEPVAPAMFSREGSDRNQNYVEQFKSAAMLEMERAGVPASITLAQGIVESGAGSSDLAQNANNHFGIKCGSNWSGKTYKKIDDEKDADGKPVESCFRKYDKVEESFLDHAEFLRDPRKYYRYGFLFALDRTDYKAWANGLESAGYSTSNTYAEQLIDIIERYKLYEYDLPDGNRPTFPPDPDKTQTSTGNGADIPLPNIKNRVGRVNDTKVVLAREGETITDVAKAYRLNINKVTEYNDRGYTPIQKLKANTRVFIQCKKDKWHGRATEHIVQDKEKMFDISQMYGVQLDKLLQRNGLRSGQEPATGEHIALKGKRKSGDAVRLREPGAEELTPERPDNLWPASSEKPAATMTPDDNTYLEEIGGGEQDKPKPEAQKPPTTPNTSIPAPGVKPPSVTGTPYPPVTSDQGSGWQADKPATVPPATQTPAVQSGYHLVVKGDTLYSISRKYNITVARLKYLNNLTEDTVKIGQRLRVR